MWKTALGGICSIIFVVVIVFYFLLSIVELHSGIKDIIEDVNIGIDPAMLSAFSLAETKTMPVIHFTVK